MAVGVVPFMSVATAAPCPSWTDNPNDATAFEFPVAATAEPTLDILETTIKTVGTDIAVVIKASSVSATPAKYGDEYAVQLSVGGEDLLFYADRTPQVGTTAAVWNIADDQPDGVATAVYDPTAKTVTITAKQAEVDKAAGKPTKGLTTTTLQSSTALQVLARPIPGYDTSPAPAEVTYTVGAACGGTTPPPTETPTPSPTTPGPGLPAGYPRGDCKTFDDTPTDAGAVIASPAAFPNEPGLDIRAVAINSTPASILAYVKIATLGDKPSNFAGDRFELAFKAGAKEYRFAVGRAGTGTSTATFGKVDGTTNGNLGVKGNFDKTNGYVVIEIDRAKLDSVHGSALANGTELTNVRAETVGMQPQRDFYADYAQHSDAAKRTYTLGESPCFEPPAAKLVNTGATTVQFTDTAALAAKLTLAADGQVLAGKPVTFTVGSRTLTATTDAAGVAKATLPAGLTAGSYSLVASFAGDDSAKAVSLPTPFTVAQEKTKIVLKVTKSGTRRTVTAKLLDDDNKPVAGQVVSWYINGKKVSAPRTNSTGVVTLTTAKPTQTVKAVFSAVSGKYLGATAQTKV